MIRRLGPASVVVLASLCTTLLAVGGCEHKKEAPPVSAPAAPPPAPPPAPEPPPPPPATVDGVTLGKGIDAGKKVTGETASFGPKDTIYASVATSGIGKGTSLKARWTFTDKKGKVLPVHEEPLTVDLDGPAMNEFHISKKSPWPPGAYEVEIFLGDKSVAKKAFSVK